MAEINIFSVVRHGKVDAYKKHIDNFDINIKSNDGQSLLHKAVAHSQVEIAIDLMERSIDVNLQDRKQQTALHYLGFLREIQDATRIAAKIIEKGGIVESKDCYGNTPLWYAAFNARGKYELVELFVRSGAKLASKNNLGKSPLDFAIQIKDENLQKILQEL